MNVGITFEFILSKIKAFLHLIFEKATMRSPPAEYESIPLDKEESVYF